MDQVGLELMTLQAYCVLCLVFFPCYHELSFVLNLYFPLCNLKGECETTFFLTRTVSLSDPESPTVVIEVIGPSFPLPSLLCNKPTYNPGNNPPGVFS